MANCISCGRALPAITFGQHNDVCADCRRAAIDAPGYKPPPNAAIAAGPRPRVTTALVAINTAVFLAMALSGISPLNPQPQQVLRWGANWGPLSLGAQPWRIWTSNYLHFGLLHILFNMWCLWDLGNLAERVFEPWSYFIIYTLCGISGSVASLWWRPTGGVGAGASGAIFGIAGALLAALKLGNLPFPKAAVQRTMRSLVMFAGYNLFFGAVAAGIDNSAHLGGLGAGLLLGAVLAKKLPDPPAERLRWQFAVFVIAGVVLLSSFNYVRHTRGYVVPLSQAADALAGDKLDDAVRNLEQAAAQRPNDPMILTELGGAYIQQNNYAKGVEILQKAVQLEPDNADLLYELGLAELRIGQKDDALTHIKKAAELDPENAGKQQGLGMAYSAKDMKDEAQDAFARAKELQKSAKPPTR